MAINVSNNFKTMESNNNYTNKNTDVATINTDSSNIKANSNIESNHSSSEVETIDVNNNSQSNNNKNKSLFDYWQDGINSIGKALGKTQTFRDLRNAGIVKIEKESLATRGNILVGLGKGIFNVVEGAADALTVVGGGIASIATGLVDIGAYATGNDLGLTNKLWNNWIKPGVEYKIVDNIADSYYSGYGKVMNDESTDFFKKDQIGFKGAEMVGEILATIAGGELLSGAGSIGSASGAASEGVATVDSVVTGTGEVVNLAKTGGLSTKVGTALFSGIKGTGEGVENAWNDGADILSGITYGAVSGAWEAGQWYLGGKVNEFSPLKANNILSTIGNIGIRSGIDGATNAMEVPARSLFQSIYNGKSWNENFENSGGISETVTQGLIGLGFSAAGEGISTGIEKIGNFVETKITDRFESNPKRQLFESQGKKPELESGNSRETIDKIVSTKDSEIKKQVVDIEPTKIDSEIKKQVVDTEPTKIDSEIKKQAVDTEPTKIDSEIKKQAVDTEPTKIDSEIKKPELDFNKLSEEELVSKINALVDDPENFEKAIKSLNNNSLDVLIDNLDESQREIFLKSLSYAQSKYIIDYYFSKENLYDFISWFSDDNMYKILFDENGCEFMKKMNEEQLSKLLKRMNNEDIFKTSKDYYYISKDNLPIKINDNQYISMEKLMLAKKPKYFTKNIDEFGDISYHDLNSAYETAMEFYKSDKNSREYKYMEEGFKATKLPDELKQILKWISGDGEDSLKSILRKECLPYMNEADLKPTLNTLQRYFIFQPLGEIQAIAGEGCLGYNQGRFNIIGYKNINDTSEINTSEIKHTIIHEANHMLSSGGLSKISNGTLSGIGIDEAATEYLTKLINPNKNVGEKVLYNSGVEYLRILTDPNLNVLTLSALEEAYYTHKPEKLEIIFDELMGQNYYKNRIVPAFDRAALEKNTNDIDKILLEIINKLTQK